ncbi:leucine-rich repeat domain-containing protein [Paenibacillus sp. Root52]|uniref:leucine-rich repeat domain-containing protein n=1 Tax=Paenibacillus sp. Root52 TaxID=1736552 RepID=UPI001F1CE783|nr:leucine-rich repeat domain-containing protein [Paenibacillus sp. Root52]
MKLEWLILQNNRIQDLTPLKNHPTLQHLYLQDILIQDITVLGTIPHLTEVDQMKIAEFREIFLLLKQHQ